VTLLDRYMIARCAPVLAAGWIVEIVLLLTETPDAATTVAALVDAVGLAVVYTDVIRYGEYYGMLGGGISPRRVVAPVIVLVLLLQALFIAFCYLYEHPILASAYIGYTLSALQPVFFASLVLPICVRSGAREPWAQVLLLLLGYIACVVVAQFSTRGARIGAGLYWMYVIPVLIIADVLLFRYVSRPTNAT
jgi:hypothetical protein